MRVVRNLAERMYLASGMWVAYAYTGAASLIGFEALSVLIGYSTAAPVGITLTIAALAVVYVVKKKLRPATEDRATFDAVQPTPEKVPVATT